MISDGHQRAGGVPSIVRRLRGVMIVLMALGLTCVAEAGLVERVQDGLWGAVDLSIPGSGQGLWRTRKQLVWDRIAGKLSRRTYRIWDPTPALGLEFFWKPDDTHVDRPGAVTGKGTLVWRRRGAPSYDRSAIVATYRGGMREGRADGEGVYRHRSGVTYRGEWRDGLMHGAGRILLPNGDEYVGGFAHGRHDGHGVYVDAGGNIYDGMFVAGSRDGDGVVVLSNSISYRALFRSGVEVEGTRVLLSPVERGGFALVASYPSYEDVRMGAIVDRRPVPDDEEMGKLSYTSESDGETLRIFPDDKDFMDNWRGRADIELSPFFGVGPWRDYDPVPVIFELENRSTTPVRILGAYLDVDESATDPEPYVQVSVEDSGSFVQTAFFIENYGWAPMENARVELEFSDAEGKSAGGPVRRSIGLIDKSVEVDLAEELERAGVQLGVTAAKPFACSSDDDARCAIEITATGVFGSLGDLVWLEGSSFVVGVRGGLEYDWRDAAGETRHKRSRFNVRLRIAMKWTSAEIGEGGEPVEIRYDPFKLPLDRKNYRISVPLRDDVPAGVTARWRIRLEAEKSSIHHFRFVVQLADGREIASRSIQLLFARLSTIRRPGGG